MKDTIYTTASAVIFIRRRSSTRTPSRWRLLSLIFPLYYKFNFRYVAPIVVIIQVGDTFLHDVESAMGSRDGAVVEITGIRKVRRNDLHGSFP
jgi:hypothetical protein